MISINAGRTLSVGVERSKLAWFRGREITKAETERGQNQMNGREPWTPQARATQKTYCIVFAFPRSTLSCLPYGAVDHVRRRGRRKETPGRRAPRTHLCRFTGARKTRRMLRLRNSESRATVSSARSSSSTSRAPELFNALLVACPW